ARQRGSRELLARRLILAGIRKRCSGQAKRSENGNCCGLHVLLPDYALVKLGKSFGLQACYPPGCSVPFGDALSTISGRYFASSASVWSTGRPRCRAKSCACALPRTVAVR